MPCPWHWMSFKLSVVRRIITSTVTSILNNKSRYRLQVDLKVPFNLQLDKRTAWASRHLLCLHIQRSWGWCLFCFCPPDFLEQISWFTHDVHQQMYFLHNCESFLFICITLVNVILLVGTGQGIVNDTLSLMLDLSFANEVSTVTVV